MPKAKLNQLTLLSPLPDLFRMEDGSRVTTAADWEKRRAELYHYAVDMQYGGMPPEPEFLEVELLYNESRCSSYRIHTGRREKEISFIMQIIWPTEKKAKYPLIIDGDGCFPYVYQDDHLEMFRACGAAFIRFNRTELAHDVREETHTDGLYAVYPNMTFSALAAWAWGYHRCLDAAIQLGIADLAMIAYTGHSRGGKTALLAGATDTRVTVVNPNGSGAGGAGCYRVHSTTVCEDGVERRGEELGDLIKNFFYWFGPEMRDYVEREGELPFDEHYLKALVAPRVLLDTEALSDAWANPAGTYLTDLAAREAYRFLGAEENIIWHFRDGYHKHKAEDLSVLIHVMQHFTAGVPLDAALNQPPFEGLEAVHEWRAPAHI